ncbi:MAG TPA: hypothetical protein VFN61_10795 [Acidimicrobiales bacterium]|nr:hypothetical protein [Acidimicrobiales bacterium]
MSAARIAVNGRALDALELRLDHGMPRAIDQIKPISAGTSLGVSLAAVRTAVGAVTFLAPSLTHFWVGPAARTAGGKVLSRSLAGRDIALGVGALLAAKHPKRLRRWVVLAAVGDLADALGTMTGGVPSRPRVLVTLLSLGAVATGVVAVSRLSADS